MRTGIIDMGTNTFNLLVVDRLGDKVVKLHSSKISVRLGEGGFQEKRIKPEAFARGLMAFGDHLQNAHLFGADQVYAFATSAVRSASNGVDFAQAILQRYKVKVDIIDGDREADLIYQGVQATGILDHRRALIMDIGGGSTEFVIADEGKIFWKKSYPLGVARILELFKVSEPISHTESEVLSGFFLDALKDLFEALIQFPTQILIGSSGSFDSLVDMAKPNESLFLSEQNIVNKIELNDFYFLHDILMRSTFEERCQMPGLIPLRVDFIVIASLFIKLIIEGAQINEVWQSAYSLKEGVLAELQKKTVNG